MQHYKRVSRMVSCLVVTIFWPAGVGEHNIQEKLTAQLVTKFVHINLQVEILSLQYP